MDYRKNIENEHQRQESYQSYGSEQPELMERPESPEQLALERDLILEEYKTDRMAILMAIKESIKNRDYDEAQAFVFKYRAAAKKDDDFAILAKMLSAKMEMQRKIDQIQTILDATPDEDFNARRALYQRILAVDADNAEAKAALSALNEIDKTQVKRNDENRAVQETNEEHFINFAVARVILIILFSFASLWNFAMVCAGFGEEGPLAITLGTIFSILSIYPLVPLDNACARLSWKSLFLRICVSVTFAMVALFSMAIVSIS